MKDLDYVPFVLAGNKCDLTEYREVPKADGEALAKKLGCKFMETSAKVGYSVLYFTRDLLAHFIRVLYSRFTLSLYFHFTRTSLLRFTRSTLALFGAHAL